MAFSASEAAFEGFRVVRREPGSVAVWAVVQLIFSAALSLLMLPVMRPLMAVSAANSANRSAGAQAATAMLNVLPLYLVILPLYLLVFAVLSAAVYRAVLRPQDKAFARLRFGADELRLAGVWILLGLLWLGVSMVVGVVLIILAIAVAMASKASPANLVLFVLVVYPVIFALLAWFSVKFSFAAPMTFAQKRIQLFASWKLTKGRFWSLLGCYLLAFVFIVIFWLLALIVDAAVAVGSTGGSITAAAASMFQPDYSSAQAYFTPARLVLLPIGAAVGVLQLTLGFAPAARAYQEIAGLSPESQAEAFS